MLRPRAQSANGRWLVTLLLGGGLAAALAACSGDLGDDDGMGAAASGSASGGGSGPLGGSPGDGGSDASGGASSGGMPAEALCFDATEAPACGEQFNRPGLLPPATLAIAADIVPASTFVALGGTVALLEVPHTNAPERYRVVRPDWWMGEGAVTILDVVWPEASGDWSVLDVWGEIHPDDFGPLPVSGVDTLALACDEATCLLLGASEGDSALSPLPGTELPAGAQVERLSVSLRTQLCAHGAEVHCLDGLGWHDPSVLPTGAGSSFSDLLPAFRPYEDYPDVEPGVASTDSGALLIEDSSGVWTALDPGSSEQGAIVALERDEAFVSVLYEDGTWLADALGDQPARCVQAGGLLWGGPLPGYGGRYAVAVDPAGHLFRRLHNWQEERYEWCDPELTVEPESFAFSMRACGIGTTLLALSPTHFVAPMGPPSCPID